MKLILVVVLGILIIGGITLFNKESKEVIPEVTKDIVPEQKTTNQILPATNDPGMTAEEHATMTGESTQGTDTGMEMPMMDSDSRMNTPTTREARMIMVSGKNFEFDVKEIRIKKGETVTIHFESADGFHDLVIDELNVRTEKLKTGGMQMVTFTADKTGTFEYYCSVGSHRMNGMVGKLIVE